MITKFKLYVEASFSNVQVTPNNTTGFAGDTSSTMGDDGFLRSGNDGKFGIHFQPRGEKDDISKSYKYRRRKKKEFKKNKKYNDDSKKV